MRPTAPTRGRQQSPQVDGELNRSSAVVRSPQQLVQYQLVTARVHAQCREFAVLEHVIQIGEFVSSRARPVELIAELLQRHPLHRLPHGTTVTASPWQRQPTLRAPGKAAERQGHRLTSA